MKPVFRHVGAVLLAGVAATAFVTLARAQQNNAQAQQYQCLSNLKQMATGMMMYVQDWDENFPPMKNTAQMQNRLRPYIRNNRVFVCPVTKKPYQPIKTVSGKSLVRMKAPASTPALSDAVPHPDGTKNIGYADGHVKANRATPGLRR